MVDIYERIRKYLNSSNTKIITTNHINHINPNSKTLSPATKAITQKFVIPNIFITPSGNDTDFEDLYDELAENEEEFFAKDGCEKKEKEDTTKYLRYKNGILKLRDSIFGTLSEIQLPDGAKITFDSKRKRFSIVTKDAKYTYKSKGTLEYNPFIETHDVLERFISYLSQHDVSKKDFMDMPMHLFIKWLVIESAKKDGEPVDENEVLQLTQNVKEIVSS